MSFIDSWYCGWILTPLFFKILFLALFVVTLAMSFVALYNKNILGAFFIFVGSFLYPNVFCLFSFPSTDGLVSLYESGKIDKKEFKRFLPYAIETDKEEAKYWEEYRAYREDKEALKKKEMNRRKEAEELVKKFKEEE